MDGRTLCDNIVEYIRVQPNGATSRALVEMFLKCKNPDPAVAHTAITAILRRDARCRCDDTGLWRARYDDRAAQPQPITGLPWAAVHFLTGRAEGAERAVHAAVWSLFETPQCLLSVWLVNPAELLFEERERLMSAADRPFEGREKALLRLSGMLDARTAVLLSYRQQQILAGCARGVGELPGDDTMLLGRLFRIAGVAAPKPLDLASCFTALGNREPQALTACGFGETLAFCAAALLRRILDTGITTREALDEAELKNVSTAGWKHTLFSPAEIARLPLQPGVYGFKNRRGEYMYIGKAKNLRRRLMGYFRDAGESSPKLRSLREHACDLTVHCCGSELESLLFEYRLIRKHAPVCNTVTEIHERKGAYAPLQDCIILLPHADAGKMMSFWFRREQKILVRPLHDVCEESEELRARLETFFFADTLAAPTDFPEQEIVVRWVKRHRDSLTMIPVHRMGSAREILDAVKNYRADIGPRPGL